MQEDRGLMITVKDGERIRIGETTIHFLYVKGRPVLRFIGPKDVKIYRENAKNKTPKEATNERST